MIRVEELFLEDPDTKNVLCIDYNNDTERPIYISITDGLSPYGIPFSCSVEELDEIIAKLLEIAGKCSQ